MNPVQRRRFSARLGVLAFWALGAHGGTLPARAAAQSDGSLAPLRESFDTGDFDTAIRTGERLLGTQPGNSELHDLLGRAYGRKAEQASVVVQPHLARKARAAFAKAVTLDASNAAALADLATYDMRAPAILGGGKAKALQEARGVVGLDPCRGHELLGALAEVEGTVIQAEYEYRRAVEAGSECARGRRALSAFFVRRKRFAEARSLWAPVHASDAAGTASGYELAEIALESGEGLETAHENLLACLEGAAPADGPRPAEIRERLALVADRLGRKDEARTQLAEALRIEPRHRDWQKRLARLSR